MSETENQETPNLVGSSSPTVPIEAGEPHQALFLVLSYLPLFELLSISAVCVSLRDAVERDVLRWQLIVDKPLSSRLTDETLRRIARKADGRLTTLALVRCFKITDSGLHEVVEKNPLLSKLYLPGCWGLTPEGVVRAVKTLPQHSQNLKSLMIGGIDVLKNEHLEVLQSHLQKNQPEQQQQQQQRGVLYHEHISGWKLVNNELQPMMDVQICPKCNGLRVVYVCSRKSCKIKQEKLQADCRGCIRCVPRCEECGGCCIESDEEVEEAICGCIMCSSCWLRLPKCNHCNKPPCKRHCEEVSSSSAESTGFVCERCRRPSVIDRLLQNHTDYDWDLMILRSTRLTPKGVLRAVKTLCQQSHNLKSLMIRGICGLNKEHFHVLQSHLQKNQPQQRQLQLQQRGVLYHKRHSGWELVNNEFHPMIDLQICPKCNRLADVYASSRKSCIETKQDKLQADRWGCLECLPKCGRCRGCLYGDYECDDCKLLL